MFDICSVLRTRSGPWKTAGSTLRGASRSRTLHEGPFVRLVCVTGSLRIEGEEDHITATSHGMVGRPCGLNQVFAWM